MGERRVVAADVTSVTRYSFNPAQSDEVPARRHLPPGVAPVAAQALFSACGVAFTPGTFVRSTFCSGPGSRWR